MGLCSSKEIPSSTGTTVDNKTQALWLVRHDGRNLQYVSERLRDDKQVVLMACSKNGNALQYASERLKGDRQLVLAACDQHGKALRHAPTTFWNDKGVVRLACSQAGLALQFAVQELKNDKELALVACSQNGMALRYVSVDLRNDKEIVRTACLQNGKALQFAPLKFRGEQEVVALACSTFGLALQHASPELRNDKDIVLIASSQDGTALQFASEQCQNIKDIGLAACSQNGMALKFVSDTLRSNKEVVMAAIGSNPESLKFALCGLNQDKDCLIKAGLWDEDYVDRTTLASSNEDSPGEAESKKIKIVLSTKFSLSEEGSSHATTFTIEFKRHPYIAANKEFVVYSPNAFNKDTCDPKWTNKNWPCRGTFSTCQKPDHLKSGVPQEAVCCWRYSFRHQLEEAFRLGGFMIQVVDFKRDNTAKITPPMSKTAHDENPYMYYALGDGQKIESEMAQSVGIKVFKFFEPIGPLSAQIEKLVLEIKGWRTDLDTTKAGQDLTVPIIDQLSWDDKLYLHPCDSKRFMKVVATGDLRVNCNSSAEFLGRLLVGRIVLVDREFYLDTTGREWARLWICPDVDTMDTGKQMQKYCFTARTKKNGRLKLQELIIPPPLTTVSSMGVP